MSEPTTNTGQAAKTLDLISEGKTPKLLSLIPKGQSPKLYLDLVKSQIMGTTAQGQPRPDDDLLLFLYVAKRTGLDPLTRQIYAIYRWNSRQGKETMTIQTSIDGMRLVAQRTKVYAGQDDVLYTPVDEATKYPTKAQVTVYKVIDGTKVAFTASARWSEYVQTDAKGIPTHMWDHMPYLMLGKCAEALALRKAFPNELSGIYAAEEMAQANNPLQGLEPPAKVEVLSGAPDEAPMANDLGKADSGVVAEPPQPAPKLVLATKNKPDFAATQRALKNQELQKEAK